MKENLLRNTHLCPNTEFFTEVSCITHEAEKERSMTSNEAKAELGNAGKRNMISFSDIIISITASKSNAVEG